MKKFYVGQKVGLIWEKTPYYYEGVFKVVMKVGIIKKLPSYDGTAFIIVGVNFNDPDKAYQFYAHEMIDFSGTPLNGDEL